MRSSIDFMLNDWLAVENLLERPRFADHSAETFSGVLDLCERMARETFAPINRLVDIEEPYVENGKVVLPSATHEALTAYAGSGMLAATPLDACDVRLPRDVGASSRLALPVLSRMARSTTSSLPVTRRKSMRRPSRSTRLT